MFSLYLTAALLAAFPSFARAQPLLEVTLNPYAIRAQLFVDHKKIEVRGVHSQLQCVSLLKPSATPEAEPKHRVQTRYDAGSQPRILNREIIMNLGETRPALTLDPGTTQFCSVSLLFSFQWNGALGSESFQFLLPPPMRQLECELPLVRSDKLMPNEELDAFLRTDLAATIQRLFNEKQRQIHMQYNPILGSRPGAHPCSFWIVPPLDG